MKKKDIIIISIVIIALVLFIMWREGAFKKKSAKKQDVEDEPIAGITGSQSPEYGKLTTDKTNLTLREKDKKFLDASLRDPSRRI